MDQSKTITPLFVCQHGKTDSEPCDHCAIAWEKEEIAQCHERIRKAEAKLKKLRERTKTSIPNSFDLIKLKNESTAICKEGNCRYT